MAGGRAGAAAARRLALVTALLALPLSAAALAPSSARFSATTAFPASTFAAATLPAADHLTVTRACAGPLGRAVGLAWDPVDGAGGYEVSRVGWSAAPGAGGTSARDSALAWGTAADYDLLPVRDQWTAGAPATASAAACPGTERVLNEMSTPAVAAYGLRQLDGAYAGPLVTVRRSSDGTTAPIGSAGDGTLDTAALASFCGAGACRVTAWHDQSGNGHDAVQADPFHQPLLVDAGAIQHAAGRPTVVFTGEDWLATGSDVPVGGSALTANAVAAFGPGASWVARLVSFTASGQVRDWDNAASAAVLGHGQDSSDQVWAFRDGAAAGSATLAEGDLGVLTSVFTGTGHRLRVGSVPGTATSSVGAFAATGTLVVGGTADTSDTAALLRGAVTEVTVFAAAPGLADLALLEADQAGWVAGSSPPGRPAAVTATPGSAEAVVGWTGPANSGGSPVTGYTATATPDPGPGGGGTCTTAAPTTTCTITGLSAGATYSVTVTATCGDGTGAASDPVTVTIPLGLG